MNKNYESSKSFFTRNIFLSIIGTVILGAAGSAIWERFLSGFTDKIIVFLARGFSLISSSYSDYLFSSVGNGTKEIFSYHLYTFFIIIFLFFLSFSPFIVLKQWRDMLEKIENYKHKLINEKDDERSEDQILKQLLEKEYEVRRNKKIIKWIVIPISLFTVLLTISSTIKTFYTYSSINYLEKSFDILAPYIEEKEILKLRSEYRFIDSKDEFNNLNLKLKKIAEDANIDLPEFKINIE